MMYLSSWNQPFYRVGFALDGDQDHNQSPFDSIKHVDNEGREYWMARELMGLLGYTNWRQFNEVIQRAIMSCRVHGENIDHHFEVEFNLVKRSQGGGSKQQNYKLSRYGSYLVTGLAVLFVGFKILLITY